MLACLNNKASTGSLPALLLSLGGFQVPRDFLLRGLLPQKRWNELGEVHEVLLGGAGFNAETTRIFSDPNILEQSIKFYSQHGLITQCGKTKESLVYSISEQVRPEISQRFQGEELDVLGIMFIAHIFPRDQMFEPL